MLKLAYLREKKRKKGNLPLSHQYPSISTIDQYKAISISTLLVPRQNL